MTAQQSLLSAQLSQIADRFDEIQGVVNLYQALGGGRDMAEAVSYTHLDVYKRQAQHVDWYEDEADEDMLY